jgi:hypothetical protein
MRAFSAVISAWKRKRLSRGQKVLAGIAILLALLMSFNPEIAAFGFFFDAALLDVLILLIGIQLQLFGLQISVIASSALAKLRASRGRPPERETED